MQSWSVPLIPLTQSEAQPRNTHNDKQTAKPKDDERSSVGRSSLTDLTNSERVSALMQSPGTRAVHAYVDVDVSHVGVDVDVSRVVAHVHEDAVVAHQVGVPLQLSASGGFAGSVVGLIVVDDEILICASNLQSFPAQLHPGLHQPWFLCQTLLLPP